ncbi:PREDICTED: sterile alpha and TIR motif-containing protein 1 isoform X2 [Calidris pugnax]|uniref:sterile alpha and TIR motif-containing protein 1 isoform X2 n=1 Tax=Calidris pugnax TaxID=198806 RepID=UPI00071D850A|nr:PREDICTED: sterile alpha and TIR motif-containing protein 1 isoform X2 [Calidris pugnax]
MPMVLTLLVSLYKLCRFFAMAGAERLVVPECVSQAGSWAGGGSSREHQKVSPGVNMDVRAALDRILPALHRTIARAKQASSPVELRKAITEIFQLVEEAWGMPTVGRDVAKVLCDVIRLEGGLDLLLNLLYTAELETKCQAGKLLEQILVAENRDRIARIGLGVILNLAKERDVPQLAQSVSGILEHMFKHTEETCFQLISDGGLDAILYWCRWTDPIVLRHCAMALANCAMYGGQANQRLMIEKRTAEWLFPLVFSRDDELIRLHACLAITVLATNKEIEKEVERSGTLALVEPFIASLDPERFACEMLGSSDNIQGRTAEDLQRLVPLLDSSRLEAQCIAAFYLCTEAAIKTRQKKTKIFSEIGATQSLKRVVCYSTSSTTSSLAKKVLRMIGEEVPRRILPTVPNWKPCEVQTWLQQIGFNKYCQSFLDHQVDGDILLRLTEEELQEDLGMESSITRKRFFRELTELKTFANYSTCDRSNLADWLGSIDPKFRQYTYNLLTCGINRNFLHRVTEQQLQEDCHIHTGFHRVRILTAAREMLHSPITLQTASNGTDVFISYRRSTGSQLASLLKVHLQLHGFSVFIDVEKLEAGKFEDKLIQSVMSARNFVLVLSPNALDKCMGDPECKDWVHKEIVTALNSGKNIVPVTDHFEWPDPETLPKDMRAVLKFNGIKWSHEYQEATIDKIIRFLQGRSSRDSSAGSENGLDCLPSLGQP